MESGIAYNFTFGQNVDIMLLSEIRNESDSGGTYAHDLDYELMCLKDLAEKNDELKTRI